MKHASCCQSLHLTLLNIVATLLVCSPVFVCAAVIAAFCGYVHWLVAAIMFLPLLVDLVVPLPRAPYFSLWFFSRLSLGSAMEKYGAEVHSSTGFDDNRNYLVVVYPHGLMGLFASGPLLVPYLVDRFGITPLIVGASVLFKLPLLRRVVAALGGIPADKADLASAMEQRHPFNATLITPGGIDEMFFGIEQEQIILKKRKGFVKMALQHGCCLVPTYAFGVNQQFRRFFGSSSCLASISSKMRASLTFWMDRMCVPYGSMPTGHPIRMVIGEPIIVERVEEPTNEQVEELHRRFCETMRKLFDDHKAQMGWEHKSLYFEDEPLPASE